MVGSLTKTFACPGLRLGYVLVEDPADLAGVRRHQPHWSTSALSLAVLPDLLESADLPAWSAQISAARGEMVALLRGYDDDAPVNVGCGTDLTIRELAEMVAATVGFEGLLEFDPTKPDGTPRKLLDVSKIGDLGWQAEIGLREGLEQTYGWYLEQLRMGTVRAA